MPRLASPLVYDLLEVADHLASLTGRPNLRKASMRRAVSSAYYAAFHALCFVCASEFVGWTRSDMIEPVYRMLDHGLARTRLTGREAAAMTPEILEIGTHFEALQDARHEADYRGPGLEVRRDETTSQIARARRIVELIEAFGTEERLRLAILLITKARRDSTQTRRA